MRHKIEIHSFANKVIATCEDYEFIHILGTRTIEIKKGELIGVLVIPMSVNPLTMKVVVEQTMNVINEITVQKKQNEYEERAMQYN